MKKTVVLYPGLGGAGHLMPMIELGKLFVQHGVAVTVALVKPPQGLEALDIPAVMIDRVVAANPSISFHVLPPSSLPPNDAPTKKHYILQMVDCVKAMNAQLRDFLRSLPAVHALVIDMFCSDALDVAAELRLPAYYFYSSCAGYLAVFLSFIFNKDIDAASLAANGDTTLSLPGAPPFKASDLPRLVLNYPEESKATLDQLPASDGVLVNTFVELETRAVRALSEGLCVPGHAMPPVYCVGPLISGSGGGGEKEHECLRWLDSQPDRSVVFLCFGSMGTFSERQLKEIAVGLERSEHRFLWVVRAPGTVGNEKVVLGHGRDPMPDLGVLLPDGFLERTMATGKGLVVKDWAPQVDVLRHRAAGAFMTHCGWNSTLEGIMAGMPLLCWPMYAEQMLTKVFIVEEMKLGVEMKAGSDDEVVTADEVETKVRWLMQSEGGRVLRERAAAAKDMAATAIEEGGSSHADFVSFLRDLDNISSSP